MSLFPVRQPKQVSKREFYRNGGFSNPKYFRKATPKGTWKYYSL